MASEATAASLSPHALPPLRQPPRSLPVPVVHAAAVGASLSPLAASSAFESASPVSPTALPAASAVTPRRPSLIDVNGVLDEFEQQQVDYEHAHEKERTRQMQRARRATEKRKREREEAAATAMAAATTGAEQTVAADASAASATSGSAEGFFQVTAVSAASSAGGTTGPVCGM